MLTFAIFIGLLIVLSLKVWKPVLKALDERDDSIRDDLDKAEASREEAAKLLEEQKEAMDNLREEAKQIREEAVALAEKQKEELPPRRVAMLKNCWPTLVLNWLEKKRPSLRR